MAYFIFPFLFRDSVGAAWFSKTVDGICHHLQTFDSKSRYFKLVHIFKFSPVNYVPLK